MMSRRRRRREGETRQRPGRGRRRTGQRPGRGRRRTGQGPGRGRRRTGQRPGRGRRRTGQRPEGERSETRRRPEEDRAEARKRLEVGRVVAKERGAGWEDRHVRERLVQDRLGSRQEERQGRLSDPGEIGLRPDYIIPRRDRSWKTTEASRDPPTSYDGFVISIPKSPRERLAFQRLLNKKMLFRAPETGPGRIREPHFRFKSGESTPDSERTDRRQNRSPEGHEAARKRHRNYKD